MHFLRQAPPLTASPLLTAPTTGLLREPFAAQTGGQREKGICRHQLVGPSLDTPPLPTSTKMGLLHLLSLNLEPGPEDTQNSLWDLEIGSDLTLRLGQPCPTHMWRKEEKQREEGNGSTQKWSSPGECGPGNLWSPVPRSRLCLCPASGFCEPLSGSNTPPWRLAGRNISRAQGPWMGWDPIRTPLGRGDETRDYIQVTHMLSLNAHLNCLREEIAESLPFPQLPSVFLLQ